MTENTPDGIVVTERTSTEEVTTVIITEQGASSYPCPGGLTEDELL